MKRGLGKIGWRLVLGMLLLLWIFHAIFMLEGRREWESAGRGWNELGRVEQWEQAWTRGPVELWRTVSLATPGAVLLSLGFMGMTIFLGVIRWRMVLRAQGLDLSFGRTMEISLVAHFFNSFLLGSTGGDLFKAYYAARETHHKKMEAVVTVVVDRLLGLFAMLLFACMMMVPNLKLLLASSGLAVFAWLIIVMMAGCGLLVSLSIWGGVSRSWPAAREWLRRLPKGEVLERALNASRRFGEQPFLLMRTFAISMALNVFCVLQIMALTRGLGVWIEPDILFVIVPMIVCFSALPIAPSGLGVRENLYVYMLGVSQIKVDATTALSVSLLAYAGSLFWSILGGIVYMTRRQRDHLDEIASEDPAVEFPE